MAAMLFTAMLLFMLKLKLFRTPAVGKYIEIYGKDIKRLLQVLS